MLKPFTLQVCLPRGKSFALCEDKLVLTVISNTRYTTTCEIAPTKLFTKSDYKENPHFRAYFTEDELDKKRRRAVPVRQEEKLEDIPKESKPSQKRKPAKKSEKPKEIKLPQLNLSSFSLNLSSKGNETK